uniref:Probable methionine--tRNA ligase, mitochondrial n=1 Tax=Schizophyllum commune (strain H4-8 / FGSC 9210) TaxID=578458 RepID=D8Q4A5_SCHCM
MLRHCVRRTSPLSRRWTRALFQSAADKPSYITTPIFYPNAVPHIGHLYSLVIADIFARYSRLRHPEKPTYFLAGTDEHGIKIQRAAEARGEEPLAFCDTLSAQFRRLSQAADISYTVFMRTTSEQHHRAVVDVWKRLDEKGLIYKAAYAGWYSVSDECFYTDAQVESVPDPKDPTKTIMISTETKNAVEWSSEENYMFRLSAFQDALLKHYKNSADANGTRPLPTRIYPPQAHAQIVDILENAPLADLSISRPRSRLSWGVPVPGDPEHSIYVWFDALLVYLSGVGYPFKQDAAGVFDQGAIARSGWPPNLQVIGKDILRFHALYLPAVLVALNFPLPGRLLSHGHWTVEGRKMSKSLGNVADPFDAMERHGVDCVRYYLARVGGKFRDDVGEYAMGYHTALCILVLSALATDDPLRELHTIAKALPEQVEERLLDMDVAGAITHITEALKLLNKIFGDVAPFQKTTSPEAAYNLHVVSVDLLRVVGVCLQPFAPKAAGVLLDALRVPEGKRSWQDAQGSDAVDALAVERGVRIFPPAQ